jgi:tetratricopeptide (TPR) repeat protein
MRKGRRGGPGGDIRNFTNRESELKVFRRLADGASTTPLPVVMFYGVGGIGKSWLLTRLQHEAEDALQLPTARLDFDPNAGGERLHGDSASALAEIRRQLDVPCPRFELAYAMMLHHQGVREAPTHRHAGQTATAWELTGELANAAVASVPGGNVLVWLGKKGAEWSTAAFRGTALGTWLASKTGSDDLLALRDMTPQQIYPQLAQRLADDLDEHLPKREGKACRALVFLDTFEALKVAGQSSTGQHYAREAWICDFYERVDAVLLVLCGRDRLTWEELDGDWRDPRYLEQHLVGGLSRNDAARFLATCGVATGPLQSAVLAVSVDTETGGAETAYHPFSLGLCVDTLAQERAQGETPDPESFRMPPGDVSELAKRFLRSLPPNHERWVVDLSLTPRFDVDAARAAFERTVGGEAHAAWETLQDFSFVRRAEGAGWWTLHPRMRDALRARAAGDPERETAAHQVWERYWQSRVTSETDDASALAWYHAWRLDPRSALTTWNRLAEDLRACLDMAGHYRALSWWTPLGLERSGPRDGLEATGLNDLGVELWQASLGERGKNLGRAIACYEAALQVRTERDVPREWAMTQNNLGIAYQALPAGDQAENLAQAVTCYEAALRVYTEHAFPREWAATQNNLGIAYRNLPTGDRGENLSRAIACYQAALRIRTERDFPQQWAMTQNNLGLVYADLPLGNRDENLARAIACYEAALRVRTEHDFPQQWAMTQNNLGAAYGLLPTGDRAENLARAITCYEAALRVYNEHDFPQNWASTQNNLGFAHQGLSTSDRRNLGRAIACYEAALRIRTERDFPQDWADTQFNLAEIYRDSGDLARAAAAFRAAARGYRTVGHADEAREAEELAEGLERAE